MRRLVFVWVLSMSLVEAAWGEESPIHIADARLKSAIEEELWVSNPTPEDMLSLTSLTIRGADISDLTGLEYAVNLRSLDLRENHLSNLEPLSGLTALESQNQISDISALAGLMCLSYVNLWSNPLNSDACETHIAQIRANNPGIEFHYERCGARIIQVSSTAGGAVISPGEGAFEYAVGAVISLEAQADPCYVFVGWSGSTTDTSNPLRYTVQGDQQIRATFRSLLDELYVHGNASGDPGPGDAKVSDPREDGTEAHPFDSIQESIEVAKNGAVIIVRPGIYREDLDLLGKKLHLLGIDPTQPLSGPCVIVEGVGTGPVVRISWGSGAECSLSGFVITKGRGWSVAAVCCEGASPTLSNCLIVGNHCCNVGGAGLYFYDSRAVLTNCTIADNYAGQDGAGLVLEDSDVTVRNSILWGNSPSEISCRGRSEPNIVYCDVRGWWPDEGNLMIDPRFAQRGQWTDPTNPAVALLVPESLSAVWTPGDYHLKSQAGRWDPAAAVWRIDDVTSPCLDAGDPATALGPEPAPNGEIINMGAYGGTTEASKSP